MQNGEKNVFTCVITALNEGKNQIRLQKIQNFNLRQHQKSQKVIKWSQNDKLNLTLHSNCTPLYYQFHGQQFLKSNILEKD